MNTNNILDTTGSESALSHLRTAIALSRRHMETGQGGPFGAVIARNDEVIAEGWNQVTSGKDPTAHAEVVAIRSAARRLDDFSLKGCTLYTSCEPCPMCLAAAYWARVDAVVFAASREDAAGIGFDDEYFYAELAKPIDARELPMRQTLADEAREVFRAWVDKPDKVLY